MVMVGRAAWRLTTADALQTSNTTSGSTSSYRTAAASSKPCCFTLWSATVDTSCSMHNLNEGHACCCWYYCCCCCCSRGGCGSHSLFEPLVQVWQDGEEGQMGQAPPEHCKRRMDSSTVYIVTHISIADYGVDPLLTACCYNGRTTACHMQDQVQ
jgi:hypothetical protein